MKIVSAKFSTVVRRGGFALTELMISLSVGLPVAGAVVLLLVQASFEQRRGFADTTVEESAYILQARIASCLRSMSSSEGLTPNYSSGAYDGNGNLLGYQTVFVFYANTNGSYTRGQISFNSNLGQVIHTPNALAPANQIVWMTNSPTMVLHQLFFNTSFNPDGSLNSSLVNVRFQMDDNGYSKQNLTNSPASIERNFSVQMRND
jgi:hypothetical protein